MLGPTWHNILVKIYKKFHIDEDFLKTHNRIYLCVCVMKVYFNIMDGNTFLHTFIN